MVHSVEFRKKFCYKIFREIAGGGNGEFNSYQNGGDIPDFNSSEFKREKEDFFGRIKRENANCRE